MITVVFVQDFDLENMCRQYESNQNNLLTVIVFTSHSNLDQVFKVGKVMAELQDFYPENMFMQKSVHRTYQTIKIARD